MGKILGHKIQYEEIVEFHMSYESPEDDALDGHSEPMLEAESVSTSNVRLDPIIFEPVWQNHTKPDDTQLHAERNDFFDSVYGKDKPVPELAEFGILAYCSDKPKEDFSAYGITDEKLTRLLSQYLQDLKEHMSGEIESFLELKYKAINEARWVQRGDAMWNHVPQSIDEEIKRKQRQQKQERAMANSEFQSTYGASANRTLANKAISEAIAKATRHVERVARREHIMADRVERVNLFITSLRRELMAVSSSISVPGMFDNVIVTLVRKDLWYDSGRLNLNLGLLYSLKFTIQEIQQWVEVARQQQNSIETARYQIEGDLEELERGLTGAIQAVETAKQINQESEEIAMNLREQFPHACAGV